jgi:hypothetical protein
MMPNTSANGFAHRGFPNAMRLPAANSSNGESNCGAWNSCLGPEICLANTPPQPNFWLKIPDRRGNLATTYARHRKHRHNVTQILPNPYGRGFDVVYFWSAACKSKWNRQRSGARKLAFDLVQDRRSRWAGESEGTLQSGCAQPGLLETLRIPKACSTRPQTPQRGMATPASAAKDDGEAEDSDFSRLFTSRPQILRVFLSSPETAEPLENAFMADLSHTTMTDAGSRWHQVKDGGGEKSKAINSSHSSVHSRAARKSRNQHFHLSAGPPQARCDRDHMSLEQA